MSKYNIKTKKTILAILTTSTLAMTLSISLMARVTRLMITTFVFLIQSQHKHTWETSLDEVLNRDSL